MNDKTLKPVDMVTPLTSDLSDKYRITDEYTNEQYHALDSISKSGLDLIAKSPAHFKQRARSINPKTASFGTAFHAKILEGGAGMLVGPNIKRSSKVDKAAWDAWFQKHGATKPIATEGKAETWNPEFEKQTGTAVVTASEYDDVMMMVEAVEANEQASELLHMAGAAELSILGSINGVDARCRPDYRSGDGNVLVDLKSCKDSSARGFARSCADYRYHVQDAFYSELASEYSTRWPEFYFIAVQSAAPYTCAVYQLSEEAKENGNYLMMRDLNTYKRCLESNKWPGHENDMNLSIPIYTPETFEYDLGDEVLTV